MLTILGVIVLGDLKPWKNKAAEKLFSQHRERKTVIATELFVASREAQHESLHLIILDLNTLHLNTLHYIHITLHYFLQECYAVKFPVIFAADMPRIFIFVAQQNFVFGLLPHS